MKKHILGISIMVAMLFTGNLASAQRVMNDPGYSIHNYKHPNKAAYAKKQQDAQPVVYLEEVKDENAGKTENSLTASSNYKGMNPSSAKIKTYRVVEAPVIVPVPAQDNNRNYKQQFPGTQKKSKEDSKTEADSPVVVNE